MSIYSHLLTEDIRSSIEEAKIIAESSDNITYNTYFGKYIVDNFDKIKSLIIKASNKVPKKLKKVLGTITRIWIDYNDIYSNTAYIVIDFSNVNNKNRDYYDIIDAAEEYNEYIAETIKYDQLFKDKKFKFASYQGDSGNFGIEINSYNQELNKDMPKTNKSNNTKGLGKYIKDDSDKILATLNNDITEDDGFIFYTLSIKACGKYSIDLMIDIEAETDTSIKNLIKKFKENYISDIKVLNNQIQKSINDNKNEIAEKFIAKFKNKIGDRDLSQFINKAKSSVKVYGYSLENIRYNVESERNMRFIEYHVGILTTDVFTKSSEYLFASKITIKFTGTNYKISISKPKILDI